MPQYVYANAEIGQHVNYGGFLNPALSVASTLRDPLPLGDFESSANIIGISVGYAF